MNEHFPSACSLDGLQNGQSAYIRKINMTGTLRRRIFDLGMVPGTKIQCVRRSPAGNPVAYFIRGTTIALRKEDAAQIHIQQTEANYEDDL